MKVHDLAGSSAYTWVKHQETMEPSGRVESASRKVMRKDESANLLEKGHFSEKRDE